MNNEVTKAIAFIAMRHYPIPCPNPTHSDLICDACSQEWPCHYAVLVAAVNAAG